MDQQETVERLKVLWQTAQELTASDLPMVRQRAEGVVGLISELMVTVAGEADWRPRHELAAE